MQALIKINILSILFSHFRSVLGEKKIGRSISGWVVFIIFPTVVAFTVRFYFNLKLADSVVPQIISAMAILLGLMFNSVVLIVTIGRQRFEKAYDLQYSETGLSSEEDIQRRKYTRQVEGYREVVANITFLILIAFIAVFIMLLNLVEYRGGAANLVLEISEIFFITEFLLTFLLVIKRCFTIYLSELSDY